MGRKKKDSITSIPQEGKPLVESTNVNNEDNQNIIGDEVVIPVIAKSNTEIVDNNLTVESQPTQVESESEPVEDISSDENGDEPDTKNDEIIQDNNSDSSDVENIEDVEIPDDVVDVAPEIEILNGYPILDIVSKDSDTGNSETDSIQEGDIDNSQDPNTSENNDSDSKKNNEEDSSLEGENNESKSTPAEKPNVIVLRAFDLGEIHYSPLRKYFIEEVFIPELLETRKIKLICKHG